MSSVAALVHAADRRLPRGVAHFCIQLNIWLAFYFAYNITRGLADRDVPRAFENGESIVRFEQRLGLLFEPELQQLVGSPIMATLATWTYWFSQFVIVGGTLFWVYFRQHDRFAFFRNWLILANMVGLVCYVAFPTAPPRMLPEWGFTDTLALAAISHESVSSLANQYAAMPSLHAMDALIVGVVMAGAVRSIAAKVIWLAWPAWVTFAVVSTGNHYWLDVIVGYAIAAASAAIVRRRVAASGPWRSTRG